MPKEDNHCVCLSVNLIYSILKMGKKYFIQEVHSKSKKGDQVYY